MPNIELARRALENIKAHPKTWNQATWHCGTAFCFAGHVAVPMSKGVLSGDLNWGSPDRWLNLEETDERPKEDISDRAKALLGVDSLTANILFNANNSLEDLENLINLIESKGCLKVEDAPERKYEDYEYDGEDWYF